MSYSIYTHFKQPCKTSPETIRYLFYFDLNDNFVLIWSSSIKKKTALTSAFLRAYNLLNKKHQHKAQISKICSYAILLLLFLLGISSFSRNRASILKQRIHHLGRQTAERQSYGTACQKSKLMLSEYWCACYSGPKLSFNIFRIDPVVG